MPDQPYYPRIAIETSADNRAVFDELVAAYPADILLTDVRRFHGDGDLVHALVVLSPLTLPFVTKIVLEIIRARKYVSVKVQGVELRGLSEQTAAGLLEKLLHKPSPDEPGSSAP